nr:reverse transcriptase domain-containing protein [Tanacetum cinerariifolium]
MTPVIRCLERGIWPKDKNEARYLRAKIGQYAMESGIFFKKGYLVPMLRCFQLCHTRDPHRILWYACRLMCYSKEGLECPGSSSLIMARSWANRSLMEGIKTRLVREKAIWVDELPNVLWAHRTSIKQSNGETLFSLTYGSEAVIPAEIGIPTYRTLMIREEYNEEEMRLNLNLLQERREMAAIREARYKKQRWNNTTTKRFACQVLGLGNLCSEETKQLGLRTEASWDQNGKDPIGSWKHTKMAPTS